MNIRNAAEYIENLLWIRTKDGSEVRLKLKPAQWKLYNIVREQVRAGKPVRVIVLKARQQGFSTLISALIFHACATQENRGALLVAHVADATNNLHQMHLRFYDRLPMQVRPMRASSNAIELKFANPSKDPVERAKEPGLRSKIRCATAGGKGVGRSDTLQYVHASEYAFWPDGINTKADTLLGILQAVPALPGTMVFIESTAKGFDDFKLRWDAAVAGRSDFVPLFVGWNEEPDYRRPVPPGTVWSAEEREMMARYGLEPEQMAWRRWCIANNCGGDVNKFNQEYPLTPEMAFIASGACWFNTAVIMARLEELTNAKCKMQNAEWETGDEGDTTSSGASRHLPLEGKALDAGNGGTGDAEDGGLIARATDGTVRTGDGRQISDGPNMQAEAQHIWLPELMQSSAVPTRRGRFCYRKIWDASLERTVISEIRFVEGEGPVTVWRDPEELTPYVIGGDTAGDGSDWFSAYVIDNTSGQMCARLYMQFDEAEYTAQVYCLGQYYNQALIGLEVNFSTYPVRSLQDWGYPRLYVRQAEDDYTHKARTSYGWRTDPVTRPAMLSELREIVEAHPEIICDEQLLREMLVFVKDKNGRPAALTGEHDDLVMGYGITLKIREQQSAVRGRKPGRTRKYTEDMLEDWRRASPEIRAMLEARWGKPE